MVHKSSDLKTPGDVIQLKQVDSTIRHAQALHESGKQPPFWVVADEQTEGYGTRQRVWRSQAGNFSGTYVMSLPNTPFTDFFLDKVVADSVCQALYRLIPNSRYNILISPPNDITALKDNRLFKIGGVLAEVFGDTVYLSAGVNLVWSPSLEDLLSEKNRKKDIAYPTSILDCFGIKISRDKFFLKFQDLLQQNIAIWKKYEKQNN